MVAVPAVTPVTTPVDEPIVAFALPLLHVPPVTRSLSVVVAPAHTLAVPAMAVGTGFTVIGLVAMQPVVNV